MDNPYILVIGASMFELEKEVNRLAFEGYKPVAGFADTGNTFVQPMFKETVALLLSLRVNNKNI